MRTVEETKKVLVDERKATVVTNLVVTGVSVNTTGGSLESSFVTLHLNNEVKMLTKEGKEEKIDSIVLSIIKTVASIREVIGSAVAHHINDTPSALELILDGATIGELYQDKAAAGPYVDPMTDKTGKKPLTAPKFVNHPFDIKLSVEGEKVCKQIKMFRTFGAAMFGM